MFRIIPEGKTFSEYALLRDGQSVLLRTATAADIPAVDGFMQSVSAASLQMRFMAAVAYVARSMIEFMCTGDPADRLCLLAIVGQGADARVIGMGNYVGLGVSGKAEVAFLVHDDFQGRGISTLVLERLAGIAAANGFIGFEAEVLYENQAMINVFRDSGFEVVQAYEGSSIHVRFPVSGVASLRERVELRDRVATANSLLPLLAPRSAAVVGASRDPDAAGSLIFRAILRSNFAGTVYPVNHQAVSVHGVRAYASIAELPERPDLVIIAVPADGVLDVVQDALRGGTKGLLVLTAGFAETGAEGAARQHELLTQVRSHGARLIGPNCLGLQNTQPEVSLNASLAPVMAPRGHIGFFSHSAALGLVILNYAAERGLGFSTFVSAGNRADVSGNDLLEYWEEDPSTDIALLYLETFGNARRFARIARRVTNRKPILCVKSARSRAGREAARAHIGAAAQSDTNVDLLFHQAGVIRADTLEEMFDVAVLLASQPLPRGNRVAVVSNSGGVLTICLDACEARGLVIAEPTAADLGALATVGEYEAAVQRAMEHDEVDALIAIFACVGNCDPTAVGRGIRRGVLRAERMTGVAKPALLCLMGAAGVLQFGAEGERDPSSRHEFPSYRFPESAALALSRAVQYAAFRAQPHGRVLWYEDADGAAARQELKSVIEGSKDDVLVLEGERASKVLRSFGIQTAASDVPETPGDAPVTLEVESDPSFGPLLRLSRAGTPPAVRITPVTDRDIREMLGDLDLSPAAGLDELLGRLSQLIEELPWLSGMTARIAAGQAGEAGGGACLAPGVKIGFRR
jgi:acyl-CoA synthetase (NDP forming)/RimJ/RimL family protein N-acetyltransferase